MQTEGYAPGPGDNPLYTAEPLTLDDLTLLSELFYLPYEHGATAVLMLQELHWLRREDSERVRITACTVSCSGYNVLMYLYLWLDLRRIRRNGGGERRSLTICAALWCGCSTDCPTFPTGSSCTTSTTTSVTSRAASPWPKPSSRPWVRDSRRSSSDHTAVNSKNKHQELTTLLSCY